MPAGKASTAPGTPAALLQRLAASTQRDEDTYFSKKGMFTACCQAFYV